MAGPLEHLSYYFKHIDQVESLDVLCDEENSFPWVNNTSPIPDFVSGKILTGYKMPLSTTGQCIDYLNNVSIHVRFFKYNTFL